VLDRVKKDYIVRTYGVVSWKDHEDFLEQYAIKTGKLLKVRHARVGVWSKKRAFLLLEEPLIHWGPAYR